MPKLIQMKNKKHILLALGLILIAALSRLVDHPMNFTPITAIALLSAFVFPGKWKLIVPFAAILLSDLALELKFGYGFHSGTWLVYLGFALMILVGYFGIKRENALQILGSTVVASGLFFLLTNFAFFYPEVTEAGNLQGYPHNWSGIIGSYVAGLPFYRNMLLGDLIYTPLLFGLYALGKKFIFKTSIA